eukprot:4688816-Heterocapsa_arctica.AAC.1
MKKRPKVGPSSAKGEPSDGSNGALGNLLKEEANSTSGSGKAPRPSCSPDVTQIGKERGPRNPRTHRRDWRPDKLPLREPGRGCGTLEGVGGPPVTPTEWSTTS